MMTPADLLTQDIQTRRAKVVEADLERGMVDARIALYEVEAELEPGLREVFTRGAFAAAVGNPSRVKVSDQQHNRMIIIGQAVELRDEDDAVYGRLKIADTAAGRDTLTLLRDDILTDLSVEFRPQQRHMKVTRMDDDTLLVRHDRATLLGVSPVGEGAYGDQARVLAVRAAHVVDVRERELAALHALTSGDTPR